MASDILFINLLIIFVSVPSDDASEWKATLEVEKREMQQERGDLEVIESLNDDVYEEFLAELPIMREVLVGDRKKKTLRLNISALGHYVTPSTGSPYRRWATAAAGANTVGRWRRTIRTRWSRPRHIPRQGPVRRNFLLNLLSLNRWRETYPFLISCYACGLNETTLPRSRLCYDMFDSDRGELHALARFFRARCFYYDDKRYYDRIEPNDIYFPPLVKYEGAKDRGMRMDYFGAYMDGCVKRYVDVGPLYTQRACRGRQQPWRSYTPNHAAHRLARLEMVARGHSDVCVHSPHASLTPFSRAVSLFVRYHVCVCSTPYCNRSHTHCPHPVHAALAALFILSSITPISYVQ